MKKLNFREGLLETRGMMPLPKNFIFEPTLTCNLNCSMCERYIRASELDKKELDLANIIRVINKLPKTIERVYISGGEPLMRKDICDICKNFLERNVSVVLQTNGTFVDTVMELAEMEGVQLAFSLDGLRDTHNKIRGRHFVFEHNIKIFHVLRNQLGKEFMITSVITEQNLRVLAKLIRFLEKKNLKPEYLIIELARRFTKEIVGETSKILGVAMNDLPLRLQDKNIPSYSYQEFTKYIARLDRKLKSSSFRYRFYPLNLINKSKEFYNRTYRENNKLYCMHLHDLRIDSQGNVIPCFCIRRSFGNAVSHSIEKIWNSKEYCKFRVKLIENNLAPVCETCYRAWPTDGTVKPAAAETVTSSA